MQVIEYGLKLNPEKCKYGKDKVQYLGFRVSNGQIYPGEKVLNKTQNFPEPKPPKQLQEFLGVSSVCFVSSQSKCVSSIIVLYLISLIYRQF